MNHHLLLVSEVQQLLNTGKQGLNDIDAKDRIRTQGLNKLPDKKKLSAVMLFFRQFKNPVICLLFATFGISVLTSHWVDAIILSVVIYVSSVIGFFQEYKAGQALERLNKLIRYEVKALRDETPISISHEQIVPGDVIVISSGDKIPADARLIEVSNFSTIESSLTGESLSLSKHLDVLPESTPLAERKNMIYAGTVAASGNARAIVIATGTNTDLGNIATMVQSTEEEQTPLQVQLLVFGKWLGIVLVVINVIIFTVGIFTGIPLLEIFMTAVAVVVSAVTEGFIPAMTVILTVGMNKLLKKNGLVRKLVAVRETLGSVTVICTDKTGNPGVRHEPDPDSGLHAIF